MTARETVDRGGLEGLLLVGWEGTLTPVPEEDAAERDLLEPWMAEARGFAGRLASGNGGVGLPMERLVALFERRLMGVYAAPVAMGFGRLTGEQRRGLEGLARRLLEDWETGVAMFARRFWAGRAALARWMGVVELPVVVSLEAAGSEVHGRAGGGVEVRFAGGQRVYYKPRAVTGEVLWAELQGRLAEVDADAGVPAAGALACEDDGDGAYGWMEGMTQGVCDEGRYWKGAGALLCVAAATGMSDLHMANVVATEGGPAVVDAECLGGYAGGGLGWSDGLVGTGLLPGGGGDLPEISGLFGRGSTVDGVRVPRWSGGATVRFAEARLLEQGNWPRESERRPMVCLPEMLEGYRRAAEAMECMRGDLLRKDGWVARLEVEHAPRVVRRSTLEYGLLMSRTLLPEVIVSEALREQVLRRGLVEMGTRWEPAEVRALMRLWVPRFTRAGQGGCGARVRELLGRTSPAEAVEEARETLAAVFYRARSGSGRGKGRGCMW